MKKLLTVLLALVLALSCTLAMAETTQAADTAPASDTADAQPFPGLTIESEYDVDRAVAEQDVQSFLERLDSLGILVKDEG